MQTQLFREYVPLLKTVRSLDVILSFPYMHGPYFGDLPKMSPVFLLPTTGEGQGQSWYSAWYLKTYWVALPLFRFPKGQHSSGAYDEREGI